MNYSKDFWFGIICAIIFSISIIFLFVAICLYLNNRKETTNNKIVLIKKDSNIIPLQITNLENKIIYHIDFIKTEKLKIIPISEVIIYSLPTGKIFSRINTECTEIIYSGDYLIISDNKINLSIIK